MRRDKVLSQIQIALKALEMHLNGIEIDQSLSRFEEEQLLQFRNSLMSLSARVERGDGQRLRLWMGRAVVDSWPTSSKLGDLILKAEEAVSQYLGN